MMKLIKCIIVMSLVFIGIVPAEAEENGSYLCVPVEYSDNVNEIEELNVLVLDDNIYVDALQLAQRFGYDLSNNDDENIFLSRREGNTVSSQIRFSTKETKVGRTMAMEIDDDQNIHYEFEAPFTSVIDEQGIWIPLEFSILIMNGSVMIYDDHLYIDTPKENFLDTFVQIRKKSSTYSFDWTDDFGYTETDWKVIGESSHLINVFNGLLEFDGDSWLTTFQSFFNNSANYDKKYGQDLAMLICTTSDKELSSMMSDISQSQALFSPDGKLASYLNDKSNIINNDINILYDQCDSLLKEVQEGNSQFVTYNRTYQKLQDMLDQKETFDSTGGKILEFQNNLSDATTVFDKLLKIGEVVGYAGEFTNQDAFAVDALYTFLGQVTGDEGLQKNMYDSMRDYEKDLKTNIIEYSGKRYFDEHIDEWIKSGLGLDKILGNQANGLLFVWSIASDMVPFISDGLQAADDFELAMYANVLQGDSFLNLLDQRDWIFSGADQITSENLHILAQDAYIYLKSCYTMREAALGSLKGKSDYVEEKAQPLIDAQNSINSDIADLLSFLKDAPEDNKNGFYGFLPEDNEEYLANYDKSVMKEWVDQYGHAPTLNDGKTLYKEVLDMYYNYIQSGWKDYYENTSADDYVCDLFPRVYSDSSYIDKIGYCFIDLNKDGIDELLIGMDDEDVLQYGNNRQGMIFDLYTYMNDRVIHLASSGERFFYQLCEDNTIYYYGSGGALSIEYCHYQLSADSPTFLILEEVFSEPDDDWENVYWHYSTSGLYNPETHRSEGETRKDISKDKASTIIDAWPQRVSFPIVHFSEYTSQ